MKNFFFVVLFALLTVSASAQLSISGKLRTLRPVTIKVVDLAGKTVLETKITHNVEFKSASVDIIPDLYTLHIGESQELAVMTNNPITISGFLNDKDISGSNLVINGMEESLKFVGLSEPYSNSKCSAEFIKNTLTENPAIEPAVLGALVYKFQERMRSYEQVKNVLDLFPENKRNSQVFDYLVREAKSREHTALGADLIDFTLVDQNSKEIKVSDFKGKIVLLDFWASWCGPCRAEMKSLHKIYEEIKGDDLVFISISLDDDREKWISAMDADNIPWVALWDKDGFDKSRFKAQFGFRSIPFIALIDKNGKIIARQLRGENVKTAIQNQRKTY